MDASIRKPCEHRVVSRCYRRDRAASRNTSLTAENSDIRLRIAGACHQNKKSDDFFVEKGENEIQCQWRWQSRFIEIAAYFGRKNEIVKMHSCLNDVHAEPLPDNLAAYPFGNRVLSPKVAQLVIHMGILSEQVDQTVSIKNVDRIHKRNADIASNVSPNL